MKLMRIAMFAVGIALIASLHAPAWGQPANLASARSFAVLSASGVNNSGASALSGNVGVGQGANVIGFPPGAIHNGAAYVGGAVATQAQNDAAAAYNDLVNRPFTSATDLSGQDLGGMALSPGMYRFSGAAHLGGILSLDAHGDRNAVFIFQVGTTLSADNSTAVRMLGGANPNNVFWQVGNSVTLGTGVGFLGNILAQNNITLLNGASLSGRAFSISGSVTLNANTVSAIFWQAVDVATGSDNLTRALWTDGNGRMVVWTMDNSGNFMATQVFGPFAGCTPVAVACGADGLTRVLWTNADGAFYLWHLDQNNNVVSQFSFPSVSGWNAVDISVGSDDKARILAHDGNGDMMIWTVDTGGAMTQTPEFGPYPGWTATRIASGADGLTRVIWMNVNGAMSLWHLRSDNTKLNSSNYGPYPGWSALDISVGSDNRARILWGDVNGHMKLWSVSNINGFVSSVIFGPVNAWNPLSITSGADGLTRVMWSENNNIIGIWNMDLTDSLVSSFARSGP